MMTDHAQRVVADFLDPDTVPKDRDGLPGDLFGASGSGGETDNRQVKDDPGRYPLLELLALMGRDQLLANLQYHWAS